MEIHRKTTPYKIGFVLFGACLNLGGFVVYKKGMAEFYGSWPAFAFFGIGMLICLFFIFDRRALLRLEKDTIYLYPYGDFPLSSVNSIFLETIPGYKGIRETFLEFRIEGKPEPIRIPFGRLAIDLEAFDQALEGTSFNGEVGLEL